ncbi:hypothetical protein [Bradyrhizobium sp. RDI18]|uniref:hypothetical protein n=1 Tax=Bradyrhizobium sp. RDI18 TaxID=3367400 RepID=UPI003717AD8B
MPPLAGANACHAESVDKAKATAFDGQMFGSPLSQNPLSQKTYACFVRRYDANHLAQHPKQKVGAMKLLVTAEDAPEDKTVNYSFRPGFATARAISIPAAIAITLSPKTPAAKFVSAAASPVRRAKQHLRQN